MVKVNAAGDVFSITTMEFASHIGEVNLYFVTINGVREYGGEDDRIDAEIRLIKAYRDSLTALDAMKETCGKN